MDSGHTALTPVPLFFRADGAGAPLLLLHGGPGAHHDYLYPQMLALAALGWVLATFLVLTWAELLIVPIALSTTTEIAPSGLTGQLLGLWYLAAALGGALGGQTARLVEPLGYGGFFLASGAVVIVVGIGFVALRRRWSGLLAPFR